MAEAMLNGLLTDRAVASDITTNDNTTTTTGSALLFPSTVVLSGPTAARGTELAKRFPGLNFTCDNAECVLDASIVVLSIKPQRASVVFKELRGKIAKPAVVISIVAGLPIDAIQKGLEHDAVVRSMPNTPGSIGRGITVWKASAACTEMQRVLCASVLSSLGKEIAVEDEGYLDMATAVSGSGPSFVLLFVEAMIDAGVHLGLPRRIADELVLSTISGTVDLYRERALHPAALRNQVTSPGGTSAEALYFLEKNGFRTALSRSVWAAYSRSVSLGQGISTALEEHRPKDNKM